MQPTPMPMPSLMPTPTLLTPFPIPMSLPGDDDDKKREEKKKKEEEEENRNITLGTLIPGFVIGIGLSLCLWCYFRKRRRREELGNLQAFMNARLQHTHPLSSDPYSSNPPKSGPSFTALTTGETMVPLVIHDLKEEKELKRRRIKDFRKGQLLGKGAFGEVCMGLELATGRLMAVKSVPLSRVQKSSVKSFLKEVSFLKTLKHRNVVRYLDARSDGSLLYIFLEFVSGGSLSSMLQQFGALTEDLAGIFTRQILEGLNYLHGQGIAHRDIKGGNCLCTKDGLVKIADFGVSKRLEMTKPLVAWREEIKGVKMKTTLHGTPPFMAPEVVKQEPSGLPADIWAVGCTVIEMLTGKPPWTNFRGTPAVLLQIGQTKGPPPEAENLVGKKAKAFVLVCTKVNPDGRPTCSELLMHEFVKTTKDADGLNTERSDRREPGDLKRLNSIGSHINASKLIIERANDDKEDTKDVIVSIKPEEKNTPEFQKRSISMKSPRHPILQNIEGPIESKKEQKQEVTYTTETGVLKTQNYEASW